MKQIKYERQGLLALDPRAFMGAFVAPPNRENVLVGDVEVVSVSGPLEHHASAPMVLPNGVTIPAPFDCYDAIVARVGAALAGKSKAVVLRIDSPGGLVAGVFDAARAIRAQAAAAGKEVIAYVDGTAASAAYALACAATRIVASDTAVIGSIGVIDTRVDLTAADAQMGVRVALVTSGSRKADGNPHQAMTAAELVERQSLVDSLAGVFFALVKDMRGVEAEPLEARCFVGAAAKSAGLVDEIQSFSDLLASVASAGGDTMSATKYEEARAALEEAAKGDGEEAKRAKAALAAMDDDGEESDDDEGDKDADATTAEVDEGDKDADEEAKAAAAAAGASASATVTISASTLAALTNKVATLEASHQKSEAQKRADLLKGAPAALAKALATAPLADVQAAMATLPKAPKVKAPPANAASATPAATRSGMPVSVSPAASKEAAEMDARMGLTPVVMGVKREGTRMTFGAMPASEAAQRAGNGGAK